MAQTTGVDSSSQSTQELEENPERVELRRRSLKVSRASLHGLAWLLLTFYATDYLPALTIRATVGLSAPIASQYLMGYVALGLVCLVVGAGFGAMYAPSVSASKYPWRWVLFPLIVAMVLIPTQGADQLLSKGVELVALLGGEAVGLRLSARVRRRLPPGPSRQPG